MEPVRVLIIEDDEAIREGIVDILEAEGYLTLAARNGEQGLNLVRSNMPDLILCDVTMPELDGFSLLSALRQDQIVAGIPFIFLTARAEKADFRQGMSLGADDYLTKPFTRAELLDAITTRLARHRALEKRYAEELQKVEERYNFLVNYDNLTRLPNRLLLRQRLTGVLTAKDHAPGQAALILLDVAQFNRVNYSLGYAAAEALLKLVAERLRETVDSATTLARLQTDEFAILLPRISGQPAVLEVVEKVLNCLSRPFKLEESEVIVRPGLGIAFSDQNPDGEAWLKKAGIALAHNKRQNLKPYEFYALEMETSSYDRLALETALRYALERREFEVHYQPQVELKSGRLVGAEALARWRHPRRGLVSPAEFIPLAEETGLIIPLGEWVLERACQQTSSWQSDRAEPLRISVNLSSLQFNQADLKKVVSRCLQEAGLEAQALDLELTESIVVQDVAATIATMQELKELGVRFSIDDFGTGYSSLSYLKNLPCDTLKIDRSFVRNITSDSEYASITTAIIEMAHNLQLKVVAEGVETESERAFLQNHACDEAQGYLYSRPLPAPEFEKLLLSGKRW